MPHFSITDILLACVIALVAVVALVQLLMFRRKDGVSQLRDAFASFQESSAVAEKSLRAELAQTLSDVRALRDEMGSRVSSLVRSMIPASTVTKSIDQRLEQVRDAVEARILALQEDSGRRLDSAGEHSLAVATAQREEIAAALKDIKESLVFTLDQYTQYLNGMITQSLAENTTQQRSQIAAIVDHLTQLVATTEQKLEALRTETDARMKRLQAENAVVAKFSMATRAFGATLASEFDALGQINGKRETHVDPGFGVPSAPEKVGTRKG